jgi:hypothetical protein
MKVKKVYTVICKWYADLESPTHIVGVYSTKKKANSAAFQWWQKEGKNWGYFGWTVEEKDLDKIV